MGFSIEATINSLFTVRGAHDIRPPLGDHLDCQISALCTLKYCVKTPSDCTWWPRLAAYRWIDPFLPLPYHSSNHQHHCMLIICQFATTPFPLCVKSVVPYKWTLVSKMHRTETLYNNNYISVWHKSWRFQWTDIYQGPSCIVASSEQVSSVMSEQGGGAGGHFR